MKSRGIAGLIVVGIVCVPWAWSQEQLGVLPHVYLPLKVGNTWVYRTNGGHRVEVRAAKIESLRVTKDGAVKNVPCFLLEMTAGERKLTEHVAVQSDGFYRFTAADKAINPPLRFFKLPLTKGQSWECESMSDGDLLKGTFTSDEETIKVPAGSFRTMTVSCPQFHVGDRVLSIKYWLAENVGIVKQSIKIDNRESTLELEQFKLAK